MISIITKRHYCLYFFLAFSFSTFSNNLETIPELLKKAATLEKQNDYSGAIAVYNEALKIASKQKLSEDISYIYKKTGDIYYRQKKYDLAKKNFKKSIEKDSLSTYKGDVYFNLALIYRKQKKTDSLMLYLRQSLAYYKTQEDSKNKFNTYLISGIIFKNNGNYDLAISYLIGAYQGFDRLGDIAKKASVSNTIASTQRLLGNLDISEQYYKESLVLRKQLGDSIKLSYGYNNLANVLKAQKKYDSAISYYSKAIDIQGNLKNNKELGKYYYNLGTVYFLQDKFSKAEIAYKTSIVIKKDRGDSMSLSNSYNELAAVYLQKIDHEKTKKYLDSASLLLNIKLNRDVLLRHYDLQSKYNESIKDYKTALEYRIQHNTLYESIFTENQSKAIQKLQEQFESKQKLQKIQALTIGNTKQKEIISLQQKDIQVRNLIILVCIILLILAIVIYYLLKQKQKIKEKKLELHRLESIFKGQELIKEKISKDLHDIVTTSYDSIRLKILALPKAENPQEIGKKIVKEIAEINTEIRLISHRISPLWGKVKEHLLTKIILEQLTEFQYYRKIFVDIQLPLPEELNNFSLESQTNFYGILLEALNNIQEHSKATEVYFQHQKKSNQIIFTIEDNGVGFNNYKSTNGIGLLNMKQRAELLGGTCTIGSTEKGTKVTIIFPIKSNML